jgi:hypothetical protein
VIPVRKFCHGKKIEKQNRYWLILTYYWINISKLMFHKIFGNIFYNYEEQNISYEEQNISYEEQNIIYEEQNINYEQLINNNTIDELKKIHEERPFNNSKCLSEILLNVSDVGKIKFFNEDLKINTNLESVIDISIENGNFPMVEYLINRGIKYSLYAKQMAMINGFYKIVLYVETFGKMRNNIGIDKIHRKHVKNGFVWSDCIPIEYQFC